MKRERLMELHQELNTEGLAIMLAKNHDYTSNSGDPFANFRASEVLGIPATTSVLVRVLDKLMRVRAFIECGTLQVKTESVRDAIVDVRNYMVLLAGLFEDGAGDGKGSEAAKRQAYIEGKRRAFAESSRYGGGSDSAG